MNKLSELDHVLGESLEHANYAAKLVREINALDTKINLADLGQAIGFLWEIRERIYAIAPELKPNFVQEFHLNEPNFNELCEIHDKAFTLESEKNFSEAEDLYRQLLLRAKLGHFRRLAESGLYRVTYK